MQQWGQLCQHVRYLNIELAILLNCATTTNGTDTPVSLREVTSSQELYWPTTCYMGCIISPSTFPALYSCNPPQIMDAHPARNPPCRLVSQSLIVPWSSRATGPCAPSVIFRLRAVLPCWLVKEECEADDAVGRK
eukprot:6209295-Pleurochrysis_carterae.AAC.2